MSSNPPIFFALREILLPMLREALSNGHTKEEFVYYLGAAAYDCCQKLEAARNLPQDLSETAFESEDDFL